MSGGPARSMHVLPDEPGDRFHEHKRWSATDRLAACNQLRAVLEEEAGLRAVAEVTADTIRQVMAAKAVSIVLLDDRGYRDVVNVGQLAPGEHRFPEEEPYAADRYPAATARLLAGEAYVSIGSALHLLGEYRNLAPGQDIGSVMGVPIMHADTVWGEVFMLRDTASPGFDRDDLQIASALAAQFGMRLPLLLEI